MIYDIFKLLKRKELEELFDSKEALSVLMTFTPAEIASHPVISKILDNQELLNEILYIQAKLIKNSKN
jgi:predicted component of type VI protein secretion system